MGKGGPIGPPFLVVMGINSSPCRGGLTSPARRDEGQPGSPQREPAGTRHARLFAIDEKVDVAIAAQCQRAGAQQRSLWPIAEIAAQPCPAVLQQFGGGRG